MADVSINVNCGCGYTTHRLEEAAEHSDRTGHKVTVLGTVTPVVENNSAGPRLEKIISTIERSRIDELRKKISGGR